MGASQSAETPSSSSSTFDPSSSSSPSTQTYKNASCTANEDVETKMSYHKEDEEEESNNLSTFKHDNLSGMALVNYQCRKKKRRYDKCVGEWYSREFMSGRSMHQTEVCGEKFEIYRECMLRGIKKEIWDRQGLPPPKEGSPLAEIADG